MALFINEIKGHFNLRQPNGEKPSIIYFVTCLSGKQYKLGTGVKIYPKFWNHFKQKAVISHRTSQINYKLVQEVNDRLFSITEQFNDFKNYICNNPDADLENTLYKFICNKEPKQTTMQIQVNNPEPTIKVDVLAVLSKAIKEDTGISQGTKDNYETKGVRMLRCYSEAVESLTSFKQFSSEFFISLRDWAVLNYKQRNGKPYTVGSINDQLKLAYTVVTKYGVKSGYLKKAEADAISYETLKDKNQDDEIALRDDEILKLYNHKCQDPKDEIIKDVFLLECTTGQRISDTSRINDSVKTVGGVDLIELVQRKTGKRIVIDLIFDIAKKILVDKYNYNVPSITGNTKMAERDVINPRIKHICKEAGVGVDETVTLIKHIAGKDKADEITVPRYTKVSTHTGRRTFVTMLSLRGWNYEQIGKYTGQTEIDTVKLYDKSKGDQSYLAIFKQSKKAGNILRMIDEQPEEKQDLLSILDNLANYEKAGINIYNLPEIKTVVRLVKSSTTVLTNSILKYRNMIWEIGKHTADTALLQIFQLKLKQAGLSTKEVIDAETLKEIWQNELANDELDYYSK